MFLVKPYDYGGFQIVIIKCEVFMHEYKESKNNCKTEKKYQLHIFLQNTLGF